MTIGSWTMTQTAPRSLRSPPPATATPTPPGARRGPRHPQPNHLLWLLVPCFAAIIGWSLGGGYLVPGATQQIVEIAGILLTGAAGLALASYVRRRNVQVERAYSAHLEELSHRFAQSH